MDGQHKYGLSAKADGRLLEPYAEITPRSVAQNSPPLRRKVMELSVPLNLAGSLTIVDSANFYLGIFWPVSLTTTYFTFCK